MSTQRVLIFPIYTLILASTGNLLNAAPDIDYATYLNSRARGPIRVQTNHAGDYYVAGTAGSRDSAFAARYDSAGKLTYYFELKGAYTVAAAAVDEAGALYLTGTAGPSFPITPGAARGASDQRDFTYDALFIAKVDPTGTRVVYSTLVGGSQGDAPRSIAVDPTGRAVIAGVTFSPDFPVTGDALYSHFDPGSEDRGFLLCLSADGTAIEYSTSLGGTLSSSPSAVRIDSSGAVYIAGNTYSPDLPGSTGSLQNGSAARSVYRRDGDSWVPLDGAPLARSLAISPQNPQVIYLGAFATIWKSTDAGLSWQAYPLADPYDSGQKIVCDPSNPQKLFALTSSQLERSEDGGETWTAVRIGLRMDQLLPFSADPNIWIGHSGTTLFRSIDGGKTFSVIRDANFDFLICENPSAPGTFYASTTSGLFSSIGVFRSADGGLTWQKISSTNVRGFVIDPAQPLHFAALGLISEDGGVTWEPVDSPGVTSVNSSSLVLDSSEGRLYAGTLAGISVSLDGGHTWKQTSDGLLSRDALAVATGHDPALTLALMEPGTDGFVIKLDRSFQPVWGTLIGGAGTDSVNGMELGADGSVYLAGTTRSLNFPVTPGALQDTFQAREEGFVLHLLPSGDQLEFGTFLGGDGSQQVSGLGVDSTGRIAVAGRSSTAKFPVTSTGRPLEPGQTLAPFLAVLQAGGQSLAYSSAVLAQGTTLMGLAIDSSDRIAIVGTTSLELPLTPNAAQPSRSSGFLIVVRTDP